MSRRNRDEDLPPINCAIKRISSSTEASYSANSQVERAFLLGLWYRSFPEYTLEHLEKAYGWNHVELMPEGTEQFEDPYTHLLRFQFTADTGDSWHQCYRDFRERGWQRLKVHRDGGRLQYLLRIGEGRKGQFPAGFDEIHLILDISISTCKTIQVGTEMKEVPVYKTVCEDLVELPDTEGQVDSIVEVNGETFVADIKVAAGGIEELQQRRSGEAEDLQHLHDMEADAVADAEAYEAEHGPEGQIPRREDFKDDMTF